MKKQIICVVEIIKMNFNIHLIYKRKSLLIYIYYLTRAWHSVSIFYPLREEQTPSIFFFQRHIYSNFIFEIKK